MKRRDAATFSVLAGMLAALDAGQARAGERGCPSISVEADATVSDRWPDLPSRIHQSLDARDDVDACARINLRMADAVVIVEVALPDGRSAVRTVSRREDIVPALEALLLLPEAIAQATTGEFPQPSAPGLPAAAARGTRSEVEVTVLGHEASGSSSANNARHVRLDLSVAAGARIGSGQVGLDLGVLSSVELGGWLVGFQGHVNRYFATSSGTPDMPPDGAAALELGVLAGRRLRFQAITLDLVAGPAVALHGTASSSVQAAPTGTAVTQTSSNEPIPRLLASSRVSFGRSALRSFVEVDGEVGSTGPVSDPLPSGPRLPAWTVGVAVGAAVGTR